MPRRRRRTPPHAWDDALTGLGNRHAYERRIAHECARRGRDGGLLTLVLVDLDGAQGDGVRRTVAAVLQRWTRSIDGVYRVGEDRFALILPGADGQSGRALTERIAERLVDAHPLAASARFGVAQAGDEDPELLYAAAEAELLRLQRADAARWELDRYRRRRLMGGARRRRHPRGRRSAVVRVGLGRHERHHRYRHQAQDDRRYPQGVRHEPGVTGRPRPASSRWWPRRGGRRPRRRSGTGPAAGSRLYRARSRTPPGRYPRSRAACAAGRDRRPDTVTHAARALGRRSAGAAQRTRPACCGAERRTTGSSGGGSRQVGHTTGSQAPGRFRSIDRSSIPRYAAGREVARDTVRGAGARPGAACRWRPRDTTSG